MTPFPLAWRSLRRSRAISFTAIGTLAIGIGATAAIFAVLNAVLFEPLPYPDADRLFGAWLALPGMHYDGAQSLATYFAYKDFARSIAGISVSDKTSVNVSDALSAEPPERLRAAQVSASFFPLLGATLEIGRGFTDAEDAPGGAPVVILSNGLWRRRFGANRAVIGSQIQVDGQQREIVGVARADFELPDAGTQLWLPIALDPHAAYAGGFAHRALIKLRPGVTADAAQRELDQLLPRAAEMFPEMFAGMTTATFFSQSGAHVILRPMRADVIGTIGGVLWIAAAAGILILLTACANVVGLLLTRADGRQRDFAVRTALGASRRRLFGQHVAESSVLASVGAVFGLALAGGGLAVLRRLGPTEIPRLSAVRIDWHVLMLILILTCGVTLLCSVVPVLRHVRGELAHAIRDGTRGGTVGRSRQRARRVLVSAQVAFAVVLVGGAVLLLRSFDRLRHVRPGFDADHALVVWMSLPKAAYPADTNVLTFTDQLLGRVASVTGVRAAAVSSKVPLNTAGRAYTPIWADNDRTPAEALPPAEQLTTVTGGYFGAMGIRLIAGHPFGRIGHQDSYETIVDRRLAAELWSDPTGTRALGRRLRFVQPNGPWFTVVGVVASVHDTSLALPMTGQVYLPDAHSSDPTFQQVPRVFGVVVRSDGNPVITRQAVEDAIQSIDHAVPVFDVSPMADVVAQSMSRLSFVMLILAVAAAVALTLAAVGLYGVISYIVNLRTKEIGVRIAMGAAPARVARFITYQGAGLAALGIAAGVALFAATSRFLGALVFGVGTVDPLTVLAMSVVLMAVALAASWFPAQRAARIDPVRALGADY